MIGLLIISHSAEIARGVKALADQMAQGHVPIAAAGGTLEGDLGTSTDLIMTALEELRSADAVLAFVDMGSAVMSAEMALEMSGVPFLLCAAPLVEGAIIAAAEASRPGITLTELAAAAEQALEAKGLAPVQVAPAAPPEPAPQPGKLTTVVTVTNKVGLHMRPAGAFVKIAETFSATVQARNLDVPSRPTASGRSATQLMKLLVKQGQQLELSAEGDDAQAALDALTALVQNKFGEPE
jgi:phosphocarrier protein FPr